MSEETATLVEPTGAEILQTHMARQNMLLDKIILQIGFTNVALELMLSPEGKALYGAQIAGMLQIYNRKVQAVNDLIQKAREQAGVSPSTPAAAAESSRQDESP